ncbi:hypothetical protein LCGC14_2701450, partial [marine sediment metagenome]
CLVLKCVYTFRTYSMKTTKTKDVKRTQRDYTLGFKLSIVEQVEKGDFTYKQAQSHYGIQGRSTVLVWLRKHGKLDWSKPTYIANMPKSKETPAQKIKRLEREIEDLRLKDLIKDEMINIMDEEYGAGLRKKYISELSRAQKKNSK